jgi:hypothetical protein
VSAEAVGFPLAAQAARLRRDVRGPKGQSVSETVALITSLPAERLDAAEWLRLNRAAWGIETGLHARLDVSRRDDQCRLRGAPAVWLHGLFARLANSPMMDWRSHQPKGRHKTTTDFMARMSADHARRAFALSPPANPTSALREYAVS